MSDNTGNMYCLGTIQWRLNFDYTFCVLLLFAGAAPASPLADSLVPFLFFDI